MRLERICADHAITVKFVVLYGFGMFNPAVFINLFGRHHSFVIIGWFSVPVQLSDYRTVFNTGYKVIFANVKFHLFIWSQSIGVYTAIAVEYVFHGIDIIHWNTVFLRPACTKDRVAAFTHCSVIHYLIIRCQHTWVMGYQQCVVRIFESGRLQGIYALLQQIRIVFIPISFQKSLRILVKFGVVNFCTLTNNFPISGGFIMLENMVILIMVVYVIYSGLRTSSSEVGRADVNTGMQCSPTNGFQWTHTSRFTIFIIGGDTMCRANCQCANTQGCCYSGVAGGGKTQSRCTQGCGG